MIDTTLNDRKRAEINQPPKAIAADAGYGNQQQLDKDAADKHIPAPNLRTHRHVASLCLRIGMHVHHSAASAATGFVNGHPSCGWDYRIRPPAGSRRRYRVGDQALMRCSA